MNWKEESASDDVTHNPFGRILGATDSTVDDRGVTLMEISMIKCPKQNLSQLLIVS